MCVPGSRLGLGTPQCLLCTSILGSQPWGLASTAGMWHIADVVSLALLWFWFSTEYQVNSAFSWGSLWSWKQLVLAEDGFVLQLRVPWHLSALQPGSLIFFPPLFLKGMFPSCLPLPSLQLLFCTWRGQLVFSWSSVQLTGRTPGTESS